MKRSIFYRSPAVFKLMLLGVHGKYFRQRYETIVDKLGDAESVFEPLCGLALITDFLPENVKYSGFDLNEIFLKHAKRKGLNVFLGDAREDEPYEGVSADGVVLIDCMHHVQPYEKQQRVMEKSVKVAKKKIIVCDPFGDRYFATIKTFPFLRGPAEWIFNWIETDGVNESRYDTIINRETLEKRMEDGYGVLRGVRHEIEQAGAEDLIVTYYL